MKLKDKAASNISKVIIKLQQQFASAMLRVSAKWKVKHQMVFLYLTCLILGGLSVITVIKPFKEKRNSFSRPGSLKVPKLFNADENKVVITDNEMNMIHAFKLRLDSMSKTPAGKTKVEQMYKGRPGLFDSLERAEELYYSQKK